MTVGWRELLLFGEVGLYLFAAACVWWKRSEGQSKWELHNMWPVALLILVCGLVFTGMSFMPGGWILAVFSLPAGYVSLHISNQQIHWDAQGFWYRTALRREIRYAYEDVSRMRRSSLDFDTDLIFRAGRRPILLDSMQGWEPFAAAYDNWRTRNGQTSWRTEEKERRMERYLRHGAFGRNLDRIPCGRLLMAFVLLIGAVLTAGGIWGLTSVRSTTPKDIVIIVAYSCMLLAGIVFPAGYIWGAAHMNKKVLRCYTKRKIRPDPLNPEKPKRYQKQKPKRR